MYQPELGKGIVFNNQKNSIVFKLLFLTELYFFVTRLRHEITKPMATADKGAKNYYQMLKCFDYDPKPLQIKTPQSILTKSKNAF